MEMCARGVTRMRKMKEVVNKKRGSSISDTRRQDEERVTVKQREQNGWSSGSCFPRYSLYGGVFLRRKTFTTPDNSREINSGSCRA